MTSDEAVALILPAIAKRGGTWVDFGAGDGTFTRALAELLGPSARIYAVDRDASAVASLQRWAAVAPCEVIPVMGDFSASFDPPDAPLLDGMLFANSLHYVRSAAEVLARLVEWLRPGGRVLFVEYDRRTPNRWLPHPIGIAKLPSLVKPAGLAAPTIVARRPSMYQGELYVAVADKPFVHEEP